MIKVNTLFFFFFEFSQKRFFNEVKLFIKKKMLTNLNILRKLQMKYFLIDLETIDKIGTGLINLAF